MATGGRIIPVSNDNYFVGRELISAVIVILVILILLALFKIVSSCLNYVRPGQPLDNQLINDDPLIVDGSKADSGGADM